MAQIKLTPERIRNIYKLLQQGETQQNIAKKYKVSRGHISKIKLGTLPEPPPHARWKYIWEENNNEL